MNPVEEIAALLLDADEAAAMEARGGTEAAVLLPLYGWPGAPGLVLTERRADLRRHAGEVSFPGGRQDDAVTDQAERVIAQDARGDEMQDGLLALDDQRMARVVATLETRDGADTFGEEIDDLALALVAPLRAENDD